MILLLCAQNACAGYFSASPELKNALDHGADTKVVFSVVDEEGSPIANALVDASFALNGRGTDVRKNTNVKGDVELKGKSVGEIVYTVKKDAFYMTSGTLLLRDFSRQKPLIKDGKWQPYGTNCNIVLKPRKNPIPMNVCHFHKGVVTNVPIGFDLRKGDYVTPYGNGEVADFTFTINERQDSVFRLFATLSISFTNALDGAYIKEKDMFSDFVSIYNADTNAVYKRQFLFEYDSRNPRKKIDTSLSDRQYLVLRTRTKVNERNEIVEAYYSKLYGRMSFTHGHLSFDAYFNPVLNDTNLEFIKETIPR